MADISSLYRLELASGVFSPLVACTAADLDVREKQIEQWMAQKPGLLFTDSDSVMIIAQEVTGELQADLLAVDSQGNLIVIEIKRHGSDRNTLGQLLDYAARLSEWDYDAFDRRWKAYKGEQAGDLFERFRSFVENPHFSREDFLRTRRLYILASEADEGLKRIIRWMQREYDAAIDFVPFGFFRAGDDVFLQIDKIDVEPMSRSGEFNGDWFFNTNETYAPHAWQNMVRKGVIACCGYGPAATKAKMDLPAKGDRVFVYVNRIGIIAIGKITTEMSEQGTGIFNTDTKGDEYHRSVEWIAQVGMEGAMAASCVSELGYNLPVRCTIGRWMDGKVAEIVARALMSRDLGPAN